MQKSFYFDRHVNVAVFKSAFEGMKAIAKHLPDLVIIGLELPDIKAENVCREIVETHPEIPIIAISDNEDEHEAIKMFELGIDNFVSTPINSELLLAKIKSRLIKKELMEHTNGTENKYSAADLVMDLDTLEVTRGGKNIELTATEFELLKLLLVNKNYVLNREKILSAVWGYANEANTRVVDVHIGHLRKKIDKGHRQKLIKSVRGFGYKLSN